MKQEMRLGFRGFHFLVSAFGYSIYEGPYYTGNLKVDLTFAYLQPEDFPYGSFTTRSNNFMFYSIPKLRELTEYKWNFPKTRGTFLGVTKIWIIVFWGLYWGTPILGNYHLHYPQKLRELTEYKYDCRGDKSL